MNINLSKILNPMANEIIRMLLQKVYYLAYYINARYTPLAILIFFIFGNIMIYTWAYLCRFNQYDFWLWKTRAILNIMIYTIALIMAKIILMEITK